MMNIDEKAIQALDSDQLLSDFINENKAFIISCAYKVTNKYITQNDDEWSIALIAFSDAIKSYQIEKGHFLPYAKLLITNKLTDYYRTNKKYNNEFSVDPFSFQANHEPEDTSIRTNQEIPKKLSTHQEHDLKYEIEAANEAFNKFGFSFYKLAKCSPKTAKTRSVCKSAVQYVINDPLIMKELYVSRLLPIKKIQKNTELPRKTLEFYRKYIIAAIEILSGEYPLLTEYFYFIREGDEK